MQITKLENILANHTYPGRGIVIGKSESGKAVIAYFIMGRSDNSRNRIFEKHDNDIYTKCFDESKMQDPSLIIYPAVREFQNHLIVTNGDQTDTIYDALQSNKTFEEALRTREFEPDAPNFTSRISGLVKFKGDDIAYKMSILKSGDKDGFHCFRYTFDYEAISGVGHFLHTYQANEEPLPAFEGEPRMVEINDDIDEFANDIWNSLNENNKISLYVRYTDILTGAYEDRIINKNQTL